MNEEALKDPEEEHTYDEDDQEITYCPICGSDVEEREWSHTVARSDGEPDELTGTALYCTDKECSHHNKPIL